MAQKMGDAGATSAGARAGVKWHQNGRMATREEGEDGVKMDSGINQWQRQLKNEASAKRDGRAWWAARRAIKSISGKDRGVAVRA